MKLIKRLGLIAVMAAMVSLVVVWGIGSVGNAAVSDDPGCYCTQPLLNLTQENVYWWGSYADYEANTLSVDYDVSNLSDNYANAHNLQIVGTNNTNGVTSIDHGRNVNMVSAGECELVTVKYKVPYEVSYFTSHVYATTHDQCGNSYDYPSPMP